LVALAAPHDAAFSGGVSATTISAATVGDTAVKSQSADVGHLQQRVFAKYDLPARDIADSLIDFFHEKGQSFSFVCDGRDWRRS